jgi:Glyoxalase-like domain
VVLRGGDDVKLTLQRADDYQPPDWPGAERPQQFHIDVTVDDVDEDESQVLALGAGSTGCSRARSGTGGSSSTRPAGHPFCLCWD